VTDLVGGATFGEVAVGEDAIAEVRVVIGAGVDDPDADPSALDAAFPHRLQVQEGDALVQQRVDGLGRTRDESRGLELAPQVGLTILGNIDHDDARAAVRLPHDRIVLPENTLGYAGLEGYLFCASWVFGGEH